MSHYRVKASAGTMKKLINPAMSKWGADDDGVIGEYLGLSEMKTKIGMAELLDLKLAEINFAQTKSEYPDAVAGDEISIFTNGSFRNNFRKLIDRHGVVASLPDGTPKVENGEIVKVLPAGTMLRVYRNGTYDTPKQKDCTNINIDILEVVEDEVEEVTQETSI